MRHAELLEARQLSRDVAGIRLLCDISFSLGSGEAVALMGPSGSGKSLLLRALAQLDPLTAGEIFLEGRSVGELAVPSYRSQVVYVPQRPFLLEGAVEDSLREPFAWRVHAHRRFDRAQVVAWLASVGRSADFLKFQHPGLSGGEMQIAAIVRAMQLQPRVLLLDEPTSALDHDSTAAIESLIQAWMSGKNESRSVVWVTHDPRQAARICHRQWRIDRGQLWPAGGE